MRRLMTNLDGTSKIQKTKVDPEVYRLAARQLLRAMRGRRSQVAFARRLGYRSNPITDWERSTST
jgi:hypothetical protein